MSPWYRGFRGSIVASDSEEGKFDVIGVVEKKDDRHLEITEIPIRKWTQDYKEFLEGLMPDSKDGGKHVIDDFREYHTENTVHFEVKVPKERLQEMDQADLEKTFKLKTSISCNNMMLFNAEGKITKYDSALDILIEFCKIRRGIYVKRKEFMVSKLTREKEI